MDARRFSRLKQEFQDLLEASPEQRAVVLERLAQEDAELGAELGAWLAAEEQRAGEWLERPVVLGGGGEGESPEGPSAAPERVGPWRLETEIGRGGMGSVFRGRRDDGAFEQTVAIKLVRSELASEVLRRRFLAERRILAGLVHPNIAHLIDGGTTEEGIPYLVLEHVAGEPIDCYCDRHALSVDERLRLLMVVCGAVGFAHQKLVLHRDLKPANVLVDEAGRPKLLDFGIAKLIAPSAEEEDWTALGVARPLTPEWASPEQLRGEPLTTASDVYSLGVLLHVLLTGRRPHRFSGQAAEVFAREIEQSGGAPPLGAGRLPAPPGVDSRSLRGDLQRIVARALAPEIARRYGTVVELVADLDRQLAGLPVSAHPTSVRYRLGKLLRRRRGAAAAVAVVAVSLLAATAVGVREARIAEAERVRAERRFDDVRRLAKVMLFDVHQALENTTGTLAARRLLVDTAVRYLDDLAREAGDEPALLRELAAGYERIGEVQGMPEWPSEGRTGDALASFQRALELERRSRAPSRAFGTTPTGGAELSAEARLLTRIGSILAARGDTGAALVRHREARDLLTRRLAATHSTAVRLELAQAQVAVGDDVWELGDVPAAVPHYRAALATARAAVAADPASTLAVRQVGVVEQRLGDAAADAGDWPRAIEHHAASLAVDRELAARRPDDVEIRRDLGTDLSRLGVDEAARGSAAAALEFHRQAGRLRQALLAEEPRDARAADDAAETHLETGKALAALGRTAEASRETEIAVGLRRSLSARDPRNVRWRDTLAYALATRAELESRRGDRARAAATLAEALVIRRRLLAESPGFASNREALLALEKELAKGGRPAPPDLDP